MGTRVLRRVLRRGSKKGLSRRHLEGRSTPFREYDPVGVCPIARKKAQKVHHKNWQRGTLKTLTSLNKEVRPFFLGDNSIWSFPSVSSLSDYSTWRS